MKLSYADDFRSVSEHLKRLSVRIAGIISHSMLTPEEWLFKGNEHLSKGNLNEALGCYRRSVERCPDCIAAWKQMGILFGMMGRYGDAIASFNEAIRIDPKNHEAWQQKGFALNRLYKYEDALICFERVIALRPKDAYARYCRTLNIEMIEESS